MVFLVDNAEEVVVVSAISQSLWREFWIFFDRVAGSAVFDETLAPCDLSE